MDRSDSSRPISTVLDGSNYVLWAHAMSSFIKGHHLWRYVTGKTLAPVRKPDETDDSFEDREEEWEAKNHRIITWLRNTSATSINMQFGRFDTAKEVWDFLAQRYTTTGHAHQYQLQHTLYSLRQEPGQSIVSFLAQMSAVWDHLALSDPEWSCSHDASKYALHRDHQRLNLFLMALTSDYEPVRASLLHRDPLPTLEHAISELVSEETRLGTSKAPSSHNVLATTSVSPTPPYGTSGHSSGHSSSPTDCSYCHSTEHLLLACPIRVCKWCNKREPRHYQADCFKNPNRQNNQNNRQNSSRYRGGQSKPHRPRSSAAATIEDSPPAPSPSESALYTLHDIEAIVKQVLSNSGTPSTALSVTSGTSSWFFDSACCNHMTSESSAFSTTVSASHLPVIHTADGSHMHVSRVGHVTTSTISLPDTYFIPKLALNLISIGQLCELGLTVLFSSTGCVVQDPKTGQTLGIGRKHGRLYELISLRIPSPSSSPTSLAASASIPGSLELWHSRLGHMSLSRLRPLISSGQLGNVPTAIIDCLSCQLAKQPSLPFNKSDSMSKSPFDLIHSDVWGPSPTSTMGGCRYFVIFVDDFTRFTWLFLMKQRSELPQLYKDFANMIKTQFSCTIKLFRADNAQEYKETSFLQFLRQHGTLSQYSCPGTSQQNGRAERKHRHLLDTVRAFLISSSCPEKFWGEAALTAAYVINHQPSSVLHNLSPYERLYGVSPTYSSLRVFGCACFVLLQPHERTKLEPRARLCCFLGYGIEHKGYRCWDPISKRLRVSRHVIFWEHKMFSSLSSFHLSVTTEPYFLNPTIPLFPDDLATASAPEIIHTADPIEPVSPPDPAPAPVSLPPPAPASDPASSAPVSPVSSDLVPMEPPVPRPTRVTSVPAHLRDYYCYSVTQIPYEPRSYREAHTNPLWQQAMDDELHALAKTHTWDLVDLPSGKTVIGCKWVYKIKTRSDGSIERYKARLVAKGFNQEYGIDYEETFAPVARLTSVRSLLAVAASRKWTLSQMDVKNAFLNGDLLEEVYMQPPPGYAHSPHQVCRLRRALYGLKQAPRAWFAKFSTTLGKFGFSSSPYDSALFLRKTAKGLVLLLLYVDDMIITGDDTAGISDLKSFLSSQFEMKDLGSVNYFLGLEVLSTSDGIYLTQAKYASDLLSRAGLTDSKVASTPIEPTVRLTPLEGTLLPDATLYRQLVGSLVYLTVTRPDLAYSVHLVSQYLAAPRSTHYAAVLRILRYVKGTLFYGLHYSSASPLVLRAYSDADWAGDPTDRRSTTGFCFLLGDSLISWRSKKQTLTAKSSTESEYRALADTTQELLWLRWLLTDMGVTHTGATSLHCDNQSAIHIAHNDVFHDRTKHIEIDCHFIRQHVVLGTVQLLSISSVDQLADIFTKAHPPGRFHDLISKLKLISALPP